MDQSPQTSLQFSVKDLLILTIVGSGFAVLMRWYGVESIAPWAFFYCLVHSLFLIGRYLALGVKEAHQLDPTAPRKVAAFDSQLEASVFVARLEDSGIEATAIGGFITGFVLSLIHI